jgi:hypothetical protein
LPCLKVTLIVLIDLDEATTIYLNLAFTKDDCPKVLDHHVPIFLWESSVINAAQWDITTQQVRL